MNKIKEKFNEEQQKIFVSSFYCYLNYDKNKDFVVDLDNVWKWLGFNQKYNALRVLEKNFILDKDYINFAPQVRGAKNESNINNEKIKINDSKLTSYINIIYINEQKQTCYTRFKEKLKLIFSFEWIKKSY